MMTREELVKEFERLQTQLAGCGVAALGGTKNPAKQGDYGWSPSYQDVLDLRLKYQEALAKLDNIGKVAGEYIAEREAEIFLSGETSENKGYWTGLAEGAKELLRRLKL